MKESMQLIVAHRFTVLEAVSQMSEQQVKAGDLRKAEEVLDVVFPSGDEAAEAVHPGK
jgi:hypothetical protein